MINPWCRGSINLTEQARIQRENPKLAERLKAAAPGADAAGETAAWQTLTILHGAGPVAKAKVALAAAKRQ